MTVKTLKSSLPPLAGIGKGGGAPRKRLAVPHPPKRLRTRGAVTHEPAASDQKTNKPTDLNGIIGSLKGAIDDEFLQILRDHRQSTMAGAGK
ncbi:MAG: hypothetical protein NTX50_15105 [Candidatus Sumerlaeota bacterium]|nr:hypothetical protein [Candidatus Sumerlaeota bacterium]